MSETRQERSGQTSGPGPTGGERLVRDYRTHLRLSEAALFWESLWPALWPLGCTLGLFLALALMDAFAGLAGWLHLVLLAGFAIAAVASVVWAARRIRLPQREAARRRLERDSGFDHRPLQALEDRLATDGSDAASQALWQAHRRRLTEQLKRLRVAPPAASWAKVDLFALRAVVGLLLVVGLVVGAGDWRFRLASAVTPRMSPSEATLPPRLDVWLNPPAYTGQAPRYLDPEKAASGPIQVPSGSLLLAQIQGGSGDATLGLADSRVPFERHDESLRLERRIETEGEVQELPLRVHQDETLLGGWELRVLPDHAPEIEYQKPPGRSQRGSLELLYRAKDDYGLAALRAVIRRVDKPDDEPLAFELGLPSGQVTESEGSSYRDLTPHPWAGIPVTVQLEARDAIGQLGTTEAFEMVMPERVFQHPVARRLVELRKQLTLHPEQRLPVARGLQELSLRPDHFFNDFVVALALAIAERRLIHEQGEAAIASVQDLLWDTALHIEEGEMALAERRLRELQQELMEALERGASDEEIERLMSELQQALDEFLRQMAEQMMQQMGEQPPPEGQPLPPDAQVLERDDLQRMIEQARELARSGARDQARQMLSQLQQMLENLRAMPMQQQMNQQARQAQQMMQNLQDMMRQQQELLDRSFQRSQQGQGQRREQPQQNGEGEGRDPGRSSNAGDAQSQEALRRELGDLMRQLGEMSGEIPRSLGQAEQSMRDARDALQQDQPGSAMQPQADAIDQLQQGLEAMLESFAQQLAGEGQEGTRPGQQPGEGRDPFGRGPEGQGLEGNDKVEIPTGTELRRAREILNELRRRRQDLDRPTIELEYLDRLLRQF